MDEPSPRKRAAKRMIIALILLILGALLLAMCAPAPTGEESEHFSLGARIAISVTLGAGYLLLLASLYRFIVGAAAGALAGVLKTIAVLTLVAGVAVGALGTWLTVKVLGAAYTKADRERHHDHDWD
jgi:small-conductance mechanosensitive channel